MALFGTDPKDQMIALLKDLCDTLRAQNEELHKQNLLLTDKQAYAIRYPKVNVPVPQKPAEPQGADLRSVPYRPTTTRAEIEKQFERSA